MDEALNRDHAELRAILRPLIEEHLGDKAWLRAHQDEYRLYLSAVAFGERFPKTEDRRRFIETKRREADHRLLLRDHAELQKILFPQIVHCFNEPAHIRDDHHDFNYYCSLDYFASRYPDAPSRRAYLDLRRAEWQQDQAAMNQDLARFRRAVQETKENRADRAWQERVASEPESSHDIER